MLLTQNSWMLLMPGLQYFGKIRSIPWLLMPWQRKEPGHQQPWYWLCRINRSLSSMRQDVNHLHHLSVDKWQKTQIYSMFLPYNSTGNKWIKSSEIWSYTYCYINVSCFHADVFLGVCDALKHANVTANFMNAELRRPCTFAHGM